MNDISTALTIVSSMVTTITSSVNDVKFNKRVCGRLARKCEWLEELLKKGELGSPSDPALRQLMGVLTVCDKDLKKFASSGFLMRIIRSGGISKVCEAHILELHEWVTIIKETTSARAAGDASRDAAASDDVDDDDDDDEDDDEDKDEDEDENERENEREDNREVMRYGIRVSKNQEDARTVLLSRCVPRQLKNGSSVNPDYLNFDKQQIGTFAFGTIYQGIYNGEAVYIRELRNDIPDDVINNIKAGIALAQCLSDCSNIVKIHGIYGDRTIVTAMPINGPLSEYTRKLTTLQKVAIAQKVADALIFMYDIEADEGRKRVVHRDIRAANILLSERLEPMLTGFEMCKGDREVTGARPDVEESLKKWWPRERVYGCGTSPESDVYSFGVLMYEISTGKEPEEGADLGALEGCAISSQYNALMRKCLQDHINARPKIDRVAEELLDIETSLKAPGPSSRLRNEE